MINPEASKEVPWLTVAWSNGKALSKLLQASWTGSDRCGESSNVSMWSQVRSGGKEGIACSRPSSPGVSQTRSTNQ